MKLKQLLSLVSKFDWLSIGTRNALVYVGYKEDFDREDLLDDEVFLVTAINSTLHITIDRK